MPELPQALSARLSSQYGISEHDIDSLMAVDAFLDIGLDGEPSEDSLVKYFERVAEGRDPKTAINWSVHSVPFSFPCEGLHLYPARSQDCPRVAWTAGPSE